MVGQIGNTLTCEVSVPQNLSPTIAYQWIRDDGSTQRQVGTTNSFPLTSVGLSDAGKYTCRATVNSDLLSNSIIRLNNQVVMVQSELINYSVNASVQP